MSNIRKIKSFTIIELMMGLLISGIVIGMTYFALLFFNTQFGRYKQKSAMINSFLLFKKAIQQDFDRSAMITYSADQRIVLSDSLLQNSDTNYSFEQSFIVRSNDLARDTFFIENTVEKIEYISDSLPLVKSLLLHTRMENNTVVAVFTKNYTARELMAAEKIDHE